MGMSWPGVPLRWLRTTDPACGVRRSPIIKAPMEALAQRFSEGDDLPARALTCQIGPVMVEFILRGGCFRPRRL